MNTSHFESGRRARIAGCHRVLCVYDSEIELREWQRGWDAADAEIWQFEQLAPAGGIVAAMQPGLSRAFPPEVM